MNSIVIRNNILAKRFDDFLTDKEIEELTSVYKIGINNDIRKHRTDDIFTIVKYRNVEELIIDLCDSFHNVDIVTIIMKKLPKLRKLRIINYDITMAHGLEYHAIIKGFKILPYLQVDNRYIIDNENQQIFIDMNNDYYFEIDDDDRHKIFKEYTKYLISDIEGDNWVNPLHPYKLIRRNLNQQLEYIEICGANIDDYENNNVIPVIKRCDIPNSIRNINL